MDAQVISNLPMTPLSIPKDLREPQKYGIKGFDAEFEVEETVVEEPEHWDLKFAAQVASDEGWFWAAGWRLAYLFFMDRASDRDEIMDCDEQDRPLHSAASC